MYRSFSTSFVGHSLREPKPLFELVVPRKHPPNSAQLQWRHLRSTTATPPPTAAAAAASRHELPRLPPHHATIPNYKPRRPLVAGPRSSDGRPPVTVALARISRVFSRQCQWRLALSDGIAAWCLHASTTHACSRHPAAAAAPGVAHGECVVPADGDASAGAGATVGVVPCSGADHARGEFPDCMSLPLHPLHTHT